ncbi:MAG: hypothetical protein KC443_08910 [Anaerolineales bacterium]|nr:hypothetical protein [Anaerolineales bacterium]
MKIKTQPLLGAAMFGILLLIIYYTVSGVFTYRITQHMLDSGMFDAAVLNSPTPPVELAADPIEYMFGISSQNFAVFSALAGLGSCLIWVGAGMGTGVIYAILHHRQESLLEAPIKGGAAAGALAYTVGTLLGSLLSMVIAGPIWREMSTLFASLSQQSGTALPPGFATQMVAMWSISIAVGVICSTLFWASMGAAMGALGSAIGKAVAVR